MEIEKEEFDRKESKEVCENR